MRFIYGHTKLPQGFYVVQVNQEQPVVAEYDGMSDWWQCGIDYDLWQYNGDYAGARIQIIKRVELRRSSVRLLCQ